ncbi:A-type flavoprotein [Spironucleus salmonicida]|uniref:A-type flavoprotein n=1 Tax=Spironucleus salmonicida TaxID=348837 RepID=V6LPN7_9EUKA|nr:A-type flavoprotein [Spironucleus salmonicida]|eukprot:EST42699.1 A-type flavoprotein [Spironucleus salmonicida]
MTNFVTSTEMLPNVFWVGAIDWTIRIFHGYHTDEGSSYNAYLIKDTIPTLIDCVKEPFWEEFLERVSAVIPLDQIKQIIVNHAEGDHTSALPLVMPKFPNATIITNKVCKEHLCILYPSLKSCSWQLVDNSKTISTGSRTLGFLLVPNLHWPDSMFTLDATNNILFSNDGFGQHIASTDRWADQVQDIEHLMYLLKEYTANILGPFRAPIRTALKAAATLKIEYILTAHGCSWRGDFLGYPLREYSLYAHRLNLKQKLLIVFDSVYGATENAAKTLSEGAYSCGVRSQICDLRVVDLTKVAYHAYDAGGIAFGSPTINSRLSVKTEAALRYLRGLQLIGNKPGCVFGAFGWAQKSLNMMETYLESANCNVIGKVEFKYLLGDKSRESLFALGCEIAEAIKSKILIQEEKQEDENGEISESSVMQHESE